MKNITLGLAPIGKFIFSHQDAIRHKRAVQQKLQDLGIDYIDLDGALPADDGIIRSQAGVGAAVRHFSGKIDALFMPHCNFGTEGAAGELAKEMGLPTLIWGPRDDAPLADGSRLRDTLCGMLASSKVVRKMVGNKFTYIENCRVEDGVFTDGVTGFARAAAVVKAAKNIRVGLVGARIDFFWSCIVNESELLEKYGVKIIPVEIAAFIKRVEEKARENDAAYRERLEALKSSWLDPSGIPEAQLVKGIAAADVLVQLRDELELTSIAVQNFYSLGEALGGGAALYTALANESVPIADESDIHGAISSSLIAAAKTEDSPVFFPEYVVRHPEDDNTVCMWHVGAPVSLRDPSAGKLCVMPPWILPGDKPIQLQMKLKNGPLTVCRFDGDTGCYRLGVGQGELVDGPYTRDFYGWLKVNDWRKWERQLIEGPYIHHCSAAYGHCADALIEACKYLDLDVEVYGG
jgi:L-fucose isomerase-like protein